jgi:pimeloyl-ACP methyl ester carboxylesterase
MAEGAGVGYLQRSLWVDGLNLRLVDEGQGPAVLLVHGFPDDHSVWRRQIGALVAAGYRVIAPDLRGCGESDMAGRVSDYHLSRLCADLDALLETLQLPQVALIGHDWGAVIGWHFAMRYPQRVSRYAALSVGHPLAYARGGLEQKLKAWYVLAFQLRGLIEWALRARNWALFRRLTAQTEEAERWIKRLRRPGRLTAAINYYRANLGLILPRRYPPVRMPVLGMWSDGDRFLTEAQMRASASLVEGQWRYERVTGAGHWLQLEAPERVNALLIGFLKSGV